MNYSNGATNGATPKNQHKNIAVTSSPRTT